MMVFVPARQFGKTEAMRRFLLAQKALSDAQPSSSDLQKAGAAMHEAQPSLSDLLMAIHQGNRAFRPLVDL